MHLLRAFRDGSFPPPTRMLIHPPQAHNVLKLLHLIVFELALFDFLSSVFDGIKHTRVLIGSMMMFQYVIPKITDKRIPSFLVCRFHAFIYSLIVTPSPIMRPASAGPLSYNTLLAATSCGLYLTRFCSIANL